AGAARDTPTATPAATSTATPTAIDTLTPTGTPVCHLTPDPNCQAPDFPRPIRIRKSTDRNKVVWKWRTSAGGVQKADFGDQLTTSDYALCIFAGDPPTLV